MRISLEDSKSTAMHRNFSLEVHTIFTLNRAMRSSLLAFSPGVQKYRASIVSLMADNVSSSSVLTEEQECHQIEGEEEFFYGAESGWVEARTSCEHLSSLSSDLLHIPTPDTPCNRCHHPAENWLCLCCKDVLCSRFVNKHMLEHYQGTKHCLALSYSDLSVWCFSCDAYLDAQVILQLRTVYETAYLLKFGEPPPFRTIESLQVCDGQMNNSSSGC